MPSPINKAYSAAPGAVLRVGFVPSAPPPPPPSPSPSQVTQTAPADWTTNTRAPLEFRLDAAADTAYTVTPTVTGGTLVGGPTKTIAAGKRTCTFEVERTTEGAVTVDFAVSPVLTRVGRNATVYFTHMPQVTGFTEEPLDMARMVWPEPWLIGGGVYSRFQVLTEWTAATETMRAERSDISGAVTPSNYRPAKSYSLLVDDVSVATTNAADGDKWLNFSFSTAGISTGWHRVRVGGLTDGETGPTHFVFMRRAGFVSPKVIPVSTSTYEIEQRPGSPTHAYGYMPSAYAPRPSPLAPRTWVPFSNQETANMIAVPLTAFDRYTPHTPNVSANGVLNSFNAQAYHWYQFIAKWPSTNLLDGPRGVGAMSMVAHIHMPTATVRADGSGGTVRHIYALDPWRMTRVSESGEIKTLVGYRHKPIASYFEDSPGFPNTGPSSQATLELVGDWSAIPVERRGFHELWGMVWLPSSVVVDDALPLIDDNGVLREQHPNSPRVLLTDTQNNRIAAVTFHPTDREAPPAVTEWLTGLGDPWGITSWENPATGQYEIIISERSNHRIVAYSEAGVFLRTIVQRDPGLPGNATLDTLRTMQISGTMTEARAQPCLGPEDVHVLDNWLYWGSYAQRQLRRIDLVTGVQEIFADLSENNLNGAIGGGYVKFSLSDGTFGPRHTAFVATWSVVSPPVIGGFLQGGGRWNFAGAIGAMDSNGYGAAVTVGQGRMLFGLSDYGIWEVYKGTKADSTLYTTGRTEWRNAFGHLKYGTYGFGTFGQALPWGQSTAMDYFLQQIGHTQPAAANDPIRAPSAGVLNTAAFIGDSNVEHPFKACVMYAMLGRVGAPLEVLANSGKSGVTFQGLVTQIDQSYTNGADPGLQGLPPLGWIFVQAGTNGLRGITSMPTDQATHIANFIAKCKLIAQHVVFVTMPPAGGVLTTQQPGYPVFREYMQGVVTADPEGRIHLLDPWAPIIDGSGNIIPEFWLVDEYHPSYAAATVVAEAAKPQLEALFANQGYSSAPLVTSGADVYPAQPQWISNPTGAGVNSFSGGWSGSLPTGWGLSNNGSGLGGNVAIIPATDLDPTDTNPVPWVRITPNLSSSYAQISLTFPAAGRAITSSDPSTLEQLLQVRADGLMNFDLLEFWMQNQFGNKFTTLQYLGLKKSGTTTGPVTLRQKYLRAGNTAGGTPQGYIYIYSVVAGSGSMGSIYVRCPSVRG